MAAPEYVVCLECETPCYFFEWKDGEVVEVICEVCGEDDPDLFAAPDDWDALESGGG
jgi:translation initiation factor 2 beta subunit (eIF-2beta)/eIF-5